MRFYTYAEVWTPQYGAREQIDFLNVSKTLMAVESKTNFQKKKEFSIILFIVVLKGNK